MSMKSVKALGVSEAMMKYVEGLRQDEIKSANSVRYMNAVYNASGKTRTSSFVSV
jgi:ATP-binding cassette, subfamily C (CFTR/MRP), member 1